MFLGSISKLHGNSCIW